MGKVFSLMENQAKKWKSARLPEEKDLPKLATVEDLVYEQSFLQQILKHRSRQLQVLRKILEAQDREFLRLWNYKLKIEKKLVGVRQVGKGKESRRSSRCSETEEEYWERLTKMSQEERDAELERLVSLKETQGGLCYWCDKLENGVLIQEVAEDELY